MSKEAHQKAFYHISKLPADIKRIPELYLQPILGKGAGRPSCRSHLGRELFLAFTVYLEPFAET